MAWDLIACCSSGQLAKAGRTWEIEDSSPPMAAAIDSDSKPTLAGLSMQTSHMSRPTFQTLAIHQ